MRKSFLTFIIAALTVVPAGAQTFQQGFLLDDYRELYRYNPAFSNESGFINIGELSTLGRTNLGQRAYLFPNPGGPGLVSGFHSSVPSETFINGLNDDNIKSGGLTYSLFAYGLARNKSYMTFEANVRGIYGISLPRELFAMLKSGSSDQKYDMGGSAASGKMYAELAYGYSYKINDIISIGARGKLLVGLVSGCYEMEKLDVQMNGETWSIDSRGQFLLTSTAISLSGEKNPVMINKAAKKNLVSGLGAAFDLGIVVTPGDYLTISLSALDIGGIFWKYRTRGSSSGTTEFTGLEINLMGNDDIDTQLKTIIQNFYGTVKLNEEPAKVMGEGVPFTGHLGVKYRMPFYDKLTVGLQGRYIDYKNMPYMEARLGVGVSPWDFLSATGNVGIGTYGPNFGLALSARIQHFHIYCGIEDGIGKRAKGSSKSLDPFFKSMTIGLTYDL